MMLYHGFELLLSLVVMGSQTITPKGILHLKGGREGTLMNLQVEVAKMCIEHGATQVIDAVNVFRERASVLLPGMTAEDSVPASVRAKETRTDASKPVKLQGRVKAEAAAPATGETKAKRVLSEEARQRIIEAQKRRHAKAKAAKVKAERQARTGISAAVKVNPVEPVEASDPVPDAVNESMDFPQHAGDPEPAHAIMAE